MAHEIRVPYGDVRLHTYISQKDTPQTSVGEYLPSPFCGAFLGPEVFDRSQILSNKGDTQDNTAVEARSAAPI